MGGRLDSGGEDDGDINDWEHHLETIMAFSFFCGGRAISCSQSLLSKLRLLKFRPRLKKSLGPCADFGDVLTKN